jgi:hypothetical protein
MIGVGSPGSNTRHIFKRLLSWALYALAIGFLIGLAWALYTYNMPVDLHDYFLPAARHVLAGGNPYDLKGFYGPPWALLPALLVAWLPDKAAYAAHGVISILALIAFLSVQKSRPWASLGALISVPVITAVLCGNLEPFVILALVVPRPLGMLLLAMKPHIGIVLALYWVLDEWRSEGLAGVARLLWPVLAAFGASVLLYGFWPVTWLGAALEYRGWNWNVWGMQPWAHVFIVGIPAVFISLWKEREDMALSAGPLLSPYTNVYGFAVWMPFMTTWPPWLIWALCLFTWALVCIRTF